MLEPNAHANPAPHPEGPLGDRANLIAILWRGWRLIAVCVLACLLLAGIYLLKTKRLYQASARLLILQNGARPLSVVSNDPSRLLEGADDFIPTHVMVIRSPAVVERAIRSVGLGNLPSLLDAKPPQPTPVQQAIEHLTVTRPDRLAKILQVDYRARSPEEATRMARAIVESYSAFLEEVYQKKNGEVITLITRARDDLGVELKELERQYMAFRQEHPLLNSEGSGRPFINRRIDEWDRAATDAIVKAVYLKSQLQLGRKLAKDGVGLWSIVHAMDQLGGPGAGTGARAQNLSPSPPSDYLRQLNQEQQQFAERYGPQNTKVKEIMEQIAQVQQHTRTARNQLEQGEIRDLLASIEDGLKSIEAMRAEIASRFDKDLVVAKRTEIDLLAEANLRSNLDRQRALFNTVVDQFKQAKFTAEFSSIRAETIEPANAPSAPVRPLVAFTLAMALAAGCVLGVGAAVAADLLDPRIRSLAEMREVLNLPLVGQVPKIPEDHARTIGPVGLICHSMPRSPSAEAYKLARANLDNSRRNRDIRVVLVTSPHAGDGKTTAASNLAISLAQAGRKVLLVDADLRGPTQHLIHGLRRERGLVHVLRDLMPAARLIQTSSVKNLDVIASGPEAPNPAELLSSPHLRAFLETVRAEYDAVILDSPPILAVADPSILGAVADAILLVVRVSATRRDDVARTMETLKALGTPVLGALVNGVGPETSAGPRSHYYDADTDPSRRERPTGEIRSDPQITLEAPPTNGMSWVGRFPTNGAGGGA